MSGVEIVFPAREMRNGRGDKRWRYLRGIKRVSQGCVSLELVYINRKLGVGVNS